jgi:hypothetical protein
MQLWRDPVRTTDLLGVDYFVGPIICEGHQAPVGVALVQGVLAACLAAWPLAWGLGLGAWGGHSEAMPVGVGGRGRGGRTPGARRTCQMSASAHSDPA